jgi:Amt family ammonium transporter
VDVSVHAESAYDFGGRIGGSFHPLDGAAIAEEGSANVAGSTKSKVEA